MRNNSNINNIVSWTKYVVTQRSLEVCNSKISCDQNYGFYLL